MMNTDRVVFHQLSGPSESTSVCVCYIINGVTVHVVNADTLRTPEGSSFYQRVME